MARVKNETDVRKQFVDPDLDAKGYAGFSQCEHSVKFPDGTRGRADYTIMEDTYSDAILAVIEAKGPGNDLIEAREQVLKYAEIVKAPFALTTNGSSWNLYHVASGAPVSVNGKPVVHLPEYNELQTWKHTIDNTGNVTVKQEVQEKDYKKVLGQALNHVNNLLNARQHINTHERGKYAQALLTVLLCDRDPRTAEQTYHLKDIIDLGVQSKRSAIDIFKNLYWRQLESVFPDLFGAGSTFSIIHSLADDTLYECLAQLNQVDLSDSDHLGDVYEYFLNIAVRNDQGQYFTPRPIVDFITNLQQYTLGERVIDPFCGTGGFLRFGYAAVSQSADTTKPEMRRMLDQMFWGHEAESTTAALAKVNMILAGSNASTIQVGNTLTKFDDMLTAGTYDKCTTNIPFIGDPTRNAGRAGALSAPDLLQYPVRVDNVEILAVQKCIMLLKEGGQAAMILPASMLTRRGGASELRRFLVRNTEIQLVVELPQYTFTHTPAASAIVLLKKRKVDKQRTLYVRVQHLGYTLNKEQTQTAANELPNIVAAFAEFLKNKTPSVGQVKTYEVTETDNDMQLSVSSAVEYETQGKMTLSQLIEDGAIEFNPKGNRTEKNNRVAGPIKEIKVRHLVWSRHPRGRDLCIFDADERVNKAKVDMCKPSAHRNVLIQKGDILFVNSGQGSIGKVAIVLDTPKDKFVPQGLLWNIRIRDKTKVDPFYLYLILGTVFKDQEYLAKQRKTARVTERWDERTFCSIPFDLPPLVEQQRQSEKLKQALLLEQQARELFIEALA